MKQQAMAAAAPAAMCGATRQAAVNEACGSTFSGGERLMLAIVAALIRSRQPIRRNELFEGLARVIVEDRFGVPALRFRPARVRCLRAAAVIPASDDAGSPVSWPATHYFAADN